MPAWEYSLLLYVTQNRHCIYSDDECVHSDHFVFSLRQIILFLVLFCAVEPPLSAMLFANLNQTRPLLTTAHLLL